MQSDVLERNFRPSYIYELGKRKELFIPFFIQVEIPLKSLR